ncbi:MAG TPA: A/G-specific adenine glycosylase, partial [Flavobacteriales bacterium]|nr:A/G-specific adenine glycosylase [Flavobacteriales bacterium]
MSSRSWFSRALLPWYRENQRQLPWRRTRDPYRIWLSEIILQQTRVDQGTAYWHRFVERYPTVSHLAKASEDQVLRLWQGLGYYSRARNLRTAAQQVVKEHGGQFPGDHATLLKLKGVGDYTASAIASICFGKAEPVVDGNVYRVLARVFGIATPIDSTEGKKEFRALAAELIAKENPGNHNQAVMELGATVCTPKNPRCGDCPLRGKCIAKAEGRIAELPMKAGKTKTRTRHFNYLLIETKGGIYLRKRTGKDIWLGLWELPMVETEKTLGPRQTPAIPESLQRLGSVDHPERLANNRGAWRFVKRTSPVKHILSHQIIHAVFWEAEPPKGLEPPKDWKLVPWNRIDSYALP